MDKKSFFIAMDGVDGTGKTTQVEILVNELRVKGYDVLGSKEPGGTAAGHQIRNILLNKQMMLNNNAELLLFCADRAEHQEKVQSHLKEGTSVISDRFLPSTYAYQIFGRMAKPDLLEAVVEKTVYIYPDLTIILDMDVDVSLKRAKERLEREGASVAEGRFEAEEREFFIRVRQGFHWYAQQERFGNSVIIDASGTVDSTAEKIRAATKDLINW